MSKGKGRAIDADGRLKMIDEGGPGTHYYYYYYYYYYYRTSTLEPCYLTGLVKREYA